MRKGHLMRILLVVGSIMIIVGIALMTWMLATEDERNNIIVKLSDGGSEIVEFEALALVPGEQCEYMVKLKNTNADEYDLSLDFVEIEEGTLKNFARVKIISGDETVYDELLCDALEDENITFPIDFNVFRNTEFKIVYYLPIEIGNEAENAEALFKLILTASNE